MYLVGTKDSSSMKPNTNKAWVVVTVVRGFIESVYLFKRQRDGLAAKQKFAKRMNPDYDECDIFVVDLDVFEAKGMVKDEAWPLAVASVK